MMARTESDAQLRDSKHTFLKRKLEHEECWEGNTAETLGAQTRRQAQRRGYCKDPDGSQIEEVCESGQRIACAKHHC